MKSLRVSSRAFTLVELLVVVAIISLLLALLTPTLHRTKYLTRSSICGSDKHQVAAGLYAYASANRGWYPARYPPKKNVYNHPYWFGRVGVAGEDMHVQFEKYIGPPVRINATTVGPPAVLVCAVAPKGIWGRVIPWPLEKIYRSNVCVYAGYDWANASASSTVPHQDLDQMPQRVDQVHYRPVAGDLLEYMTGNSVSGFIGWNTSHCSDASYHVRGSANTESPPPDPIPYVMGDGSVIFTREFEPCYTDAGWGTNYWMKLGER
ncbi:MAG TPA: prepilin-type N-terminal cleavage/methylation domain-containing protein [Phycisphaerae bacterium]|nr:prepilin-type N-terminal cleavage/methylation domain-containing protein [Phycisphaerae bacterium]HQL76337.1 prepilin-type N-terminal cleavage/methylation domain-containing protein [Phycisphaerae bacterium]